MKFINRRGVVVLIGIALILVIVQIVKKKQIILKEVDHASQEVWFVKELDSLVVLDMSLAEGRLEQISAKGLDKLTEEELSYFYNYEITVDLENGYMDSIPYYANRALLYVDDLGNMDLKSRLYYNLGKYYRFIGDYSKSLEYSLEGVVLTKDSEERRVDYYNNLGGIYFEIDDFDLSLEYLRKAYDLATVIQDSKRSSIAYANIGNVYLMTKRYDEARRNILESYKHFTTINDTLNTIKILTSWSRIELLESNYTEAKNYLVQAEELCLSYNNHEVLGLIYQHFGNLYGAQGNHKISIEYYNKAYAISVDHSSLRGKMNALDGLSKNLILLQKFKQANASLIEFYSVRDSLKGVKVKQRMEELKWSKILSDQRLENDLLYKKVETEKLNRASLTKTYIIIIILIVGGIIFIGLLYQGKRKSLRISNLTNDLLSDRIETEENLKKLQKEQFQLELEARNKELISLNILILAKNKIFNEIDAIIENEGNELKDVLIDLKGIIRSNRNQENEWEKFKDVFEKSHPEFFETIKEKYSQLSKTEVRVCTYIKIGMTSSEICGMLNINHESLNKSRYRIRKKLNLLKADDLDELIKSW